MSEEWLAWLALVVISFAVLEAIGYYGYGYAGTFTAHVRAWSYLHPIVPVGYAIFVIALAYHFWKHS